MQTKKVIRTVVVNARIFDGENEDLRAGTLIIEDGVFKEVRFEPLKSQDQIPNAQEDEIVVDAGGHVVTPGMIDCHVHALLGVKIDQLPGMTDWEIAIRASKSLENMLMRGFTTIRDAGGLDGSLARCVDEGLIAGPRVFPSGKFISQTCGHFDFFPSESSDDSCGCHAILKSTKNAAFVADGVDQVLFAVRDNLKHGATQIKIAVSGGVASAYDPIQAVQYTPAEVEAAVTAASNWGTYVMAHCYHDRGARMAIDCGVKSLEHGHLLSEETVKLCKEKDIVIQSQWVVYWVLLNYGKLAGLTDAQIEKAKQLQSGLKRIGELLKKYGIRTGFGTDLIGPTHDFQNKEFTLRKEHFSNFEILRQATVESASIVEMCGKLNRYPKLGVIRPGAAADLLIHHKNPLDDVSVMESYNTQLLLIMRGGVIFKNLLSNQP